MSTSSSSDPVRFGVLGCADIAWRRTLPAMVACDAVRLTAVASRQAEKAARFAARFGCAVSRGYHDLLECDGIDAVYVPLPAMLHAEWVRHALQAGKHVLVEKPLAASHREAAELIELADSLGLVLYENYAFLHHSQHAFARQLLAQEAIGVVRSFASGFTIPAKPVGDMRYDPRVGGGALLDVGVYPLRAALHFFGPDIDIVGAVLRRDGGRGAVLSGQILACSAQGVPIVLILGMENSYRSYYEFSGACGRILIDNVFTTREVQQPVVRVERQDHREEIIRPAEHQVLAMIQCFTGAVRGETGCASCQGASRKQAFLIDEISARAQYIEC
jgi:NDP-hexose-3-ketoreductase